MTLALLIVLKSVEAVFMFNVIVNQEVLPFVIKVFNVSVTIEKLVATWLKLFVSNELYIYAFHT